MSSRKSAQTDGFVYRTKGAIDPRSRPEAEAILVELCILIVTILFLDVVLMFFDTKSFWYSVVVLVYSSSVVVLVYSRPRTPRVAHDTIAFSSPVSSGNHRHDFFEQIFGNIMFPVWYIMDTSTCPC